MAFSINRRSRQQSPKTATGTTSAANPAERLADAEQELITLLDELAAVRQTLSDHQQQRQALLSNEGDLAQIIELDRHDYKLRLRDQQIEQLLPGLQDAVQQAHIALHTYRWTLFRPRLVVAQQELAQAIRRRPRP
jgi:Holliday junction resolvase